MVGTEQYLQSHPEINFIFGINASATLGGIAACENAGRLDITHASSGAEPPILALLKKPLSAQGGGVVWDIGYGKSAVQYGNHLVEVAAKAITARAVAGLKIDIGFQEVWRDNVDQVIATMQEWRKKANLAPDGVLKASCGSRDGDAPAGRMLSVRPAVSSSGGTGEHGSGQENGSTRRREE